MPWSERCQPFRLGRWLVVFTLKGWELSDQGIALVFGGIALVFRGIALVFWGNALVFWGNALVFWGNALVFRGIALRPAAQPRIPSGSRCRP
jgi:intracellular septation protein A